MFLLLAGLLYQLPSDFLGGLYLFLHILQFLVDFVELSIVLCFQVFDVLVEKNKTMSQPRFESIFVGLYACFDMVYFFLQFVMVRFDAVHQDIEVSAD